MTVRAPGSARDGTGSVLVVGSVNVDLVTRVSRFPQPGETLLGSDYETHHGGKGANQAVAAARMGARVSMLGRVGRDAFGARLRDALATEGIDVRRLEDVEGPSGAAFITVDATGQNTIVVAPGANARLAPDDLPEEAFREADVVVLQHEIAPATVARAIEMGRRSGATVLVNAAPARAGALRDLSGCDLLIVNETEGATLLDEGPTGAPDAILAALAEVVPAVVLTLGARGVAWRARGTTGRRSAHSITPVDTTAAGDAFVGSLAAALANGLDLAQAVRLGNAAGALAATRAGAQPSLPHRAEVERMLDGAGAE
mgnify:CR=1 FL=1